MLVACAATPPPSSASVPVTDAGATTASTSLATTNGPSGLVPDLPTFSISVAGVDLQVWVADDAAERSQGLRGVEAPLPDDIDGMLFVWDGPTQTAFIMEDTLMPLDVWFFDAEGVLIGSHEMTPCTSEPCPRYPAPGPVSWALETPLGGQGFDVGDRLSTSASG